MKKSVLGVLGSFLFACGGSDAPPPATPASSATQPVAVVEAPKVPEKAEKPKLSPVELHAQTVAQFVEALNAHDGKKLAACFSERAVLKAPGSPDAVGRAAIAAAYQTLFDGFVDFKTAVNRELVKEDVVVVEWAYNGTHTGALGPVPATQKKTGSMGLDLMWFDADGLIKEQHSYSDSLTTLAQVGLVKAKARPIPTLPAQPEIVVSKGTEPAKNLEVAKALPAAMDGKKEADYLALLSDSIEWDDYTSPVAMKGKGDAKKYLKDTSTAFPDAKHTILNAYAIGDYVVLEDRVVATNKGALMGMKATNKAIDSSGAQILLLENGKVARGWSFANGMVLAKQLGLVP